MFIIVYNRFGILFIYFNARFSSTSVGLHHELLFDLSNHLLLLKSHGRPGSGELSQQWLVVTSHRLSYFLSDCLLLLGELILNHLDVMRSDSNGLHRIRHGLGLWWSLLHSLRWHLRH